MLVTSQHFLPSAKEGNNAEWVRDIGMEAKWLGMALMRGPRAKPGRMVQTTFAESLSPWLHPREEHPPSTSAF